MLADKFGVSRDTVRRVLREFINKGVIYSMTGVGNIKSRVGGSKAPLVSNKMIGFCLSNRGLSTFDARMLVGFEDGIRSTPYCYVLHVVHSVQEEIKAFKDFQKRGVCGMALTLYGGHGEQNNVEHLAKSGLPYVLLERFLMGHESPYVVSDEAMTMDLAVESLASQGCERILYLNEAQDNRFSSTIEQRAGFLTALKQHGLPCNADSAQYVKSGRLGGVLKEIADMKPRPTGLCCNGWLLPGIQRGLESLGIYVPEGMKVMAIGGVPSEIKVLSVETDTYEIGRQGALALVDMIEQGTMDARIRVAPVNGAHATMPFTQSENPASQRSRPRSRKRAHA